MVEIDAWHQRRVMDGQAAQISGFDLDRCAGNEQPFDRQLASLGLSRDAQGAASRNTGRQNAAAGERPGGIVIANVST